jgi:IS30 family transposase
MDLSDRVKVTRLSEKGISARQIAEEMGVGKTQLEGIVRKKRKS